MHSITIDCDALSKMATILKAKALNPEKAYKFLTIDFEPAFSDSTRPLLADEQSKVSFLGNLDGMQVVYQFKKIDKAELKRRVKEVVESCKQNNTKFSAKQIRAEELKVMLAEAEEQEKTCAAFQTKHGWAFPSLHSQLLKAVGFGKGDVVDNLTKMWQAHDCPASKVTIAKDWTRTFRDDEVEMAMKSQEEGGEVKAFEYGSGEVAIAKNGALTVKCLPDLLEEILTEVYASQ
jgi:hypothetical protein